MSIEEVITVHDANIFIDMIEGGFIDLWFSTNAQTCTSELVFDEIDDPHQISQLKTYREIGKLEVIELSGKEIAQALFFQEISSSLALSDCSVLHIAEKKNAILLTGDKALAKLATQQHIEVHGTLWILDKLIENNFLLPFIAADKLKTLLSKDRRLPLTECTQRINRWMQQNDRV